MNANVDDEGENLHEWMKVEIRTDDRRREHSGNRHGAGE